MNNFKKGGLKKGGGGFGGRPKFFGVKKFGGKFRDARDGDDRPVRRMELFPAVCSECGKNCQVPFRPSGDKPVYCRDCFDRQAQVPGRNNDERQYRPASVRAQREDGVDGLRRQLVVLESKVNRILELLSNKMEK